MLIEVWSDVVCPWCAIGERRLGQALTRHGRDDVTVVYRSFELDPTAPQHGTEPVVEVLGRKYGGGAPAGRQLLATVTEVAAEVGLSFDFASAPHARTRDAHRLLHLALDEGGPRLQGRVNQALLSAYFEHARSMGDHAALREAVVGAGVEERRVEEVLAGEEYAEAVAADLAEARTLGITGVPFFLVDRRLAVSGAQPVEVFEQLLAQAAEPAA